MAILSLQVLVYLLYPLSAVSLCASTYTTLAVTVERYLAVCRPHQYRELNAVRLFGLLWDSPHLGMKIV